MTKCKMALIAAAPLAVACASAPPPAARMASAESSTRAAREVGAESVPAAQLHLKLADEEIQKAKALSKDDENLLADSMLQRASADAELALALAREADARSQADKALEQEQRVKTNPAQQ